MIQLSVILPTYNEKENISKMINTISRSLHEFKNQFEIIVVDDNSPDKTYQIAQKISKKKYWVQVIRRLQRKGLASAVVDGFSSARGSFLIVMDADMQHDASILPAFWQAFKESNDIVIGSRNVAGGGVEHWPFLRRLISCLASVLARLLLPIKVNDPMSGYFGIKKETFERIIPFITNPRGFKILLLFLTHAKKYKIKEIGYIFRNRLYGKSKLSTNVIMDYLMTIYELTLGKIMPISFMQYILVGLVGVGFHQGGLFLGKNILKLPDKYALLIGIELGVLNNFLLNNLWTFSDNKIIGIPKQIIGFFKFNIICSVGIIMNYAITLYIVSQITVSIYIASLFGITCSAIWNYIVNVNITWKTFK